MPNSATTGRKMGVKIKTAGVISIKIPINNNVKLISNKITILLSLIDMIPLLIISGMFSNDNTQHMLIDAPIRNMTMAVVEEDFNKILDKFLKLISL